LLGVKIFKLQDEWGYIIFSISYRTLMFLYLLWMEGRNVGADVKTNKKRSIPTEIGCGATGM